MAIERTPISVAYRTKRGAVRVEQFTDLRCPDPLITKRSTKLPQDCEILEIGVGTAFYKMYRKKYLKKND